MKKLAIIIAIIVGLGVTATLPRTAECVWCPTYKCYGSCGSQCVCMSKDHGGGTCVSFQQSQELARLGWSVR